MYGRSSGETSALAEKPQGSAGRAISARAAPPGINRDDTRRRESGGSAKRRRISPQSRFMA